MADRKKKKPAMGASVPPPSQDADFFSQLQNTFERGVVSAEVDIGGLINEKGGGTVQTMFGGAPQIATGPGGVPKQTFKKMKNIADMYGGRYTTHAPMQANPADVMPVGRAKAASLLKKSLDYSEKLGSNVMTVHPIGQMEFYFTDPFVGTKMPVQNPFYLAKDKDELKGLFRKFGVKDPLLKDQIEKEWNNWVRVLPSYFAEKFGAMAVKVKDDFADHVSSWRLGELVDKHGSDVSAMKKELNEMGTTLDNQVHNMLERKLEEIRLRPGRAQDYLNRMELHEERAKNLWPEVAMSDLHPIGKDGTRPGLPARYRELARKHKEQGLTRDEEREFHRAIDEVRRTEAEMRKEAWGEAIENRRFGPFEESERDIEDAVRSTFRQLFKGIVEEKGPTYRAMKQGKLKVAIENLFPAAPERGYMQGFAYFYRPENVARMVKVLQKEAEDQGLSKDAVTLTFDVGHAASSKHATGLKPGEFLEEVKKHGVNPDHVHIVGGPGYGHQHVAWGDWLDEVSRMDPGIFEKLVDAGVVNIEGASINDIDVTLNAMWDRGLPVEAMMAMAGSPDAFTPELARYSGFDDISYLKGVARSYQGKAMPQRAFYSFQQELTPMPMRSAYGSYTAPGLSGGGYVISGPRGPPSVWESAQTFLYSAKKEGGGM